MSWQGVLQKHSQFSLDGRLLYVLYDRDDEYIAELWDTQTWSLVMTLPSNVDVAFSPDGLMAFADYHNNLLTIMDTLSFETVTLIASPNPQ